MCCIATESYRKLKETSLFHCDNRKMRQPKSKRTPKERTIQEILDSDDEISITDYIEPSYVPAYQDDTRFECLQDIQRKNKGNTKETPELNIPNPTGHIKKAIFNKKDTFCLQCVQHTIAANTLLWFFEYLLRKDSHSNYKFLTSCLVIKYENNYSGTATMHETSNKSNLSYRIVVKE